MNHFTQEDNSCCAQRKAELVYSARNVREDCYVQQQLEWHIITNGVPHFFTRHSSIVSI